MVLRKHVLFQKSKMVISELEVVLWNVLKVRYSGYFLKISKGNSDI